jgi:O-methyltransferase
VNRAKTFAKRVVELTAYEIRRRPVISKATGDRLDMAANRAIARIRSSSMVAHEGLVTLYEQVAHCETAGLPGALVECGVWKGGAAALMAIANLDQGSERRALHLFDSFAGIPEPIAQLDGERAVRETVGKPENAQGRLRTANDYSHRGGPGSENEVRALLGDVGYPQELVYIHQGWFQETVPADATSIGPVALLRLDGDLYESTKICLEHLYEHVVSGGFIVIDDYGAYDGCRWAVDEFLAKASPLPFLCRVNSDIRYWIKP